MVGSNTRGEGSSTGTLSKMVKQKNHNNVLTFCCGFFCFRIEEPIYKDKMQVTEREKFEIPEVGGKKALPISIACKILGLKEKDLDGRRLGPPLKEGQRNLLSQKLQDMGIDERVRGEKTVPDKYFRQLQQQVEEQNAENSNNGKAQQQNATNGSKTEEDTGESSLEYHLTHSKKETSSDDLVAAKRIYQKLLGTWEETNQKQKEIDAKKKELVVQMKELEIQILALEKSFPGVKEST